MSSLVLRIVHPIVLASVLTVATFAQTTELVPQTVDLPERPSRRSFNPDEMRDRMMGSLREQFQVEDDAEWEIIAERIVKLTDLRRASLGGAAALASRTSGPGGPGQGADLRARRGGPPSPEAEALSAAIKGQATDAELKARLDRLREVRKQNEVKIAQVQEELREVLNLRQEAIAVLSGLLP